MGFLRTKRLSLHLLCLLAVAAIANGCIKEKREDCSKWVTFAVRAYDADNNEITTPINDVMLYLFDDQMKFIEQIQTTVGSNVSINVPATGGIHIVGWGNISEGTESMPSLVQGDLRDAAFIRLNSDTRSITPSCYPPDDIFYGELTVLSADQTNKTIPLHRKVGSMRITVMGLKEFASYSDADYRVIIRETCSSIDFYGQRTGDMISYRPTGTFETVSGTEMYSVPAFNMIPEQAGLNIDIYHGNDLVYTASSYSGGNPIIVEEGRLTEVTIDFDKTIDNVEVSITSWGGNQGSIEF